MINHLSAIIILLSVPSVSMADTNCRAIEHQDRIELVCEGTPGKATASEEPHSSTTPSTRLRHRPSKNDLTAARDIRTQTMMEEREKAAERPAIVIK
jgi:hypothetical protein